MMGNSPAAGLIAHEAVTAMSISVFDVWTRYASSLPCCGTRASYMLSYPASATIVVMAQKCRLQCARQQGSGAPIRNIGSLDAIGERQAEHIDQNMVHPVFHPLEGVKVADLPPTSMAVTDWPSI